MPNESVSARPRPYPSMMPRSLAPAYTVPPTAPLMPTTTTCGSAVGPVPEREIRTSATGSFGSSARRKYWSSTPAKSIAPRTECTVSSFAAGNCSTLPSTLTTAPSPPNLPCWSILSVFSIPVAITTPARAGTPPPRTSTSTANLPFPAVILFSTQLPAPSLQRSRTPPSRRSTLYSASFQAPGAATDSGGAPPPRTSSSGAPASSRYPSTTSDEITPPCGSTVACQPSPASAIGVASSPTSAGTTGPDAIGGVAASWVAASGALAGAPAVPAAAVAAGAGPVGAFGGFGANSENQTMTTIPESTAASSTRFSID